jgi:nuclear pore complex protein Nup155
MLLALASGNTYLDGECSSNGPVIHVSSEIAAVAKQAFYDFGERPIWTERVTYGTAGKCSTNVLIGCRD